MSITSPKQDISTLQLQSVKNKIKVLVTHLVTEHLKKDGVYFETEGDFSGDLKSAKIIDSNKSARSITNTLLPYVAWVTNQYITKFYGFDKNYFTFSKREDAHLKGVFHLDFEITANAYEDITAILLFFVVVFQDRFESNYRNKIILNRMCFLLSE